MALTLHWNAAESADDTHDDISTDISGVLVALVTQDTSPSDPSLGWRWCIEDWTWEPDGAWPPPEPTTLAHGYIASQQAGRTAVMDWVRQHERGGSQSRPAPLPRHTTPRLASPCPATPDLAMPHQAPPGQAHEAYTADLVEKYRIEESDPPVEPGTSLWLRFFDFDVNIQRVDEGVVVDIWQDDHIDGPVASTYAFDEEDRND